MTERVINIKHDKVTSAQQLADLGNAPKAPRREGTPIEITDHLGPKAPRVRAFPAAWECPECGHENKRYMGNCWECGLRRPRWAYATS